VDRFRAYPELVEQIVELLTLAAEVDQEISTLNQTAPNGEHRRLNSVELTARQLQSFSIAQPPIAQGLRLPSWQQSEQFLWPKPEPFTPPFQPGPFNPAFSDEWYKPPAQVSRRKPPAH
jgi:hypothetical protein